MSPPRDPVRSVMPPRLLFLMNEALFFTTHRLPLGLAMQKAGFDVHVAAPFDAERVAIIKARGFTWHELPLKRGAIDPFGELKLLFACLGLIRRLKPDLVHLVAMKPVIWGGMASRLLRVPAVVHAITGLGHVFIRTDLRARLLQALLKSLYRFALNHPNSRAIFQNPDDRRLFFDQALVEPRRTIMIRGCGVDMALFRPEPEPAGEPLVMFPARLLGDKGVHEFVAAARQLKREGSAARFVLVGRTDMDNPTAVDEATVQSWVRDGAVEWWGYIDNGMPATLNRAHVVCMPSYREGLPRGLIEAAACGRPIVTTDVPGCREVVRHGENGLLVPVRDAAATASAIRRLLQDGDLRRRFGQRGREIAVGEFSVERFVAESLAVYRAVLALGKLP